MIVTSNLKLNLKILFGATPLVICCKRPDGGASSIDIDPASKFD